jgi:hypothetical protein
MTRKAMAGVWVGFVFGLASCSEPECADGEQKVGTVCVRTSKSDAGAGASGEDSAWGETGPAAAPRRDGGRDASGAQPRDGSARENPEPLAIVPAEEGSVSCSDAPQCIAETSAPCATSCGTAGTGPCTDDCRLAAPESCTAPDETCNGKDDDCDGIIDLNLYERRSSGARVWTAAESADMTSTAVLPSPGGFWLLLRPQAQGAIELHELDNTGKSTGKTVQLERTNTLGFFLAASDGRWIAIAIAGRISGESTTFVQLYRADDASFVSEFEFANDRTDCGQVQPTGLALAEDGPTVRLAIGRSRTNASLDANGTCPLVSATGFNEIFFLSFAQSDSWSSPVSSGLRLPTSLIPTAPNILKMPCRKEWLVSYADSADKALRRYSFAGVELARTDALVTGMDRISSLSTVADDCGAGNASIAIAYYNGTVPDVRTQVRRLQLKASSGELTKQGEDLRPLDAPLYGAQLQGAGGKAFLAALDRTSVPRMFEFTGTSPLTRELLLSPIGRPDPALATANGQSSIAFTATNGKRISSARNGDTLVLSVASDTTLLGLDDHREPGDLDPAVAATYRIGCPE